MNNEKFLPIGTVVMLKGGTKRIMITGFLCIGESDKNKIYDYNGCVYPEGFMSADKNLLFNHDQIATIYYMGFSDDEDKKFKEKLNDAVKRMGIQGATNINNQ